MTASRTFLGMNIVGDLNNGREPRKRQRPASELAYFFQAVFADGVIDGVRWTQYTPYFNDGDVCEFSVNEYSLMVRLTGRKPSDDEVDEMEASAEYGTGDDFAEGWIETDTYGESVFDKVIGTRVFSHLPDGRRDYSTLNFQGPRPDLAFAVYALRSVLGGGEFDDALLELFGDHAQVTVPAQGDIEIESYDHD